jgi:hypothetical protein
VDDGRSFVGFLDIRGTATAPESVREELHGEHVYSTARGSATSDISRNNGDDSIKQCCQDDLKNTVVKTKGLFSVGFDWDGSIKLYID